MRIIGALRILFPMSQSSSWLQMVLTLSRAILLDRETRRKWLGGMAFAMLGLFAVGLWGIPGWLDESRLRFLCWWLGVTAWTLAVLLFAFYDALAVIREERDKMK